MKNFDITGCMSYMRISKISPKVVFRLFGSGKNRLKAVTQTKLGTSYSNHDNIESFLG